MAKVQYSAVVGDARGKVGGNVLTKGRFGAVVRTKVSPVQPRSSHQRNVRSSFTGHSKAWSLLASAAMRTAWDSFARANPIKDVFGNTRILTGHQMYVRVNRVIEMCGGTKLDVPPLSLSIGEPGIVTAAAVHNAPGTVTMTPTVNPAATECAELWAAPPLNPGRKFVGSIYRLLGVAPAGQAGPYHDGGTYEGRFGTIQVGQTIRVMVKYANKFTGAQGFGAEASCVAT